MARPPPFPMLSLPSQCFRLMKNYTDSGLSQEGYSKTDNQKLMLDAIHLVWSKGHWGSPLMSPNL